MSGNAMRSQPPSWQAALRLGFAHEGVVRLNKGHSRDTAWFSILDLEWQGVAGGTGTLASR